MYCLNAAVSLRRICSLASSRKGNVYIWVPTIQKTRKMNLENIARYIASKMDIGPSATLSPENFDALDFSMLDYEARIELLFLVEKFYENTDHGNQGMQDAPVSKKKWEAINAALGQEMPKEYFTGVGDLCVKYKHFSAAIEFYKKAENKDALLDVASNCIETKNIELAIVAYNAAGETGEPFAKFLGQFAQKPE